MFRLYLTLLLTFLFSHSVANAQGFVLKSVSIDTIFPQQLKITWLYGVCSNPSNPSDIDPNVTIYRCLSNCNDENNYSEVAQVVMNMGNLEWIDPDYNPNNPSRWRYSIGCAHSGKSLPQNNMVLTGTPDSDCANAILLSWNPYINMMGDLGYYSILYRDKNDSWSHFTPVGTVRAEDALTDPVTFDLRNLTNDKTYEIVIKAVSKNNTTHAFSNIIEFKAGSVPNTPVRVKITCVDVIDDEYLEINVITEDFPQPFQKLYLYRDKPAVIDEPSLAIIDSIMDYSPTNAYRFTDRTADPHSGLYYYMVEADNKCKANDRSGIVTNIFLEGWREEKYKDAIIFSRRSIPALYEFYSNYELFNIVYGREYSVMSNLTISTYYPINVLTDLIGVGEDVNKYKVRSNGMPGVNECICTSNTVSVEHDPIVAFPNAFYPQDKQIENRTFYPILQFPLEKNYLFIVFNRWGQEVFRSTLPPVYGMYENPQGRWDGNFQGRICPAGIYGYKLTYSFDDGTGNHVHTGSVMLVR